MRWLRFAFPYPTDQATKRVRIESRASRFSATFVLFFFRPIRLAQNGPKLVIYSRNKVLRVEMLLEFGRRRICGGFRDISNSTGSFCTSVYASDCNTIRIGERVSAYNSGVRSEGEKRRERTQTFIRTR